VVQFLAVNSIIAETLPAVKTRQRCVPRISTAPSAAIVPPNSRK